MNNSKLWELSLCNVNIKRIIVSLVIVAFFAFGDFSIYVYAIKAIAILSLLFLTRYIRNDSYFRWIFVFTIWCAISYLWAVDKSIVISYLIWYLQAVLLAYAIGTTIKCGSDIEFILKCIMLGGLILSLRSIQGVSLIDLGTFRLGKNIGYNANELALKASLSSIIAFRYFRESDRMYKKIGYLAFAIIPLIAIVFSRSRKGLIMVTAAIFLYSIICSSNPVKLLWNTCLAVAGIIVLYLLMTRIEFLYKAFGRRFLLLFNIFDEGAYVGNSIENRLYDIEVGLEAFKEKPLLGYGLGNYMAATGLGGYAHNNYIQLLVDLGIVGIMLYYSFYIRNLINLVRTIKTNRGLLSLLLSMLLVIVVIEYGLVSFNSDYVQLVVMICFYAVRISRIEKAERMDVQKAGNNL